MKPRQHETVISASAPFSWSESEFKVLIVSGPWPYLDSLFARYSVKSLCNFCSVRSNQRRILLSGCFWQKMDTNVQVRECSRRPKVCFSLHKALMELCAHCHTATSLMFSAPCSPGRFELKNVLRGYFLAFCRHSRIIPNVLPSPNILRLASLIFVRIPSSRKCLTV